MKSGKILVIGMGFVGLTFAVQCAKNYEVFGVEHDPANLESLKNGEPPFFETGLDHELSLAVSEGRLSFSEAIPDQEFLATVIAVGTPLEGGEIQHNGVFALLHRFRSMKLSAGLIILRSTLPVGTTAKLANQFDEFRFTFCPERTIEGKAMQELTELPQIIGADNEVDRATAKDFFIRFGVRETIETSGWGEAEFAKIAANTFRDSMFAVSNELALAGRALEINAIEAIKTTNYKYPRGAIPMPGLVGGPCLSKDPTMLSELGSWSSPIKASRTLNLSLPSLFLTQNLAKITKAFDSGGEKTVLVLGLAFKGKPVTSDTRGNAVGDIRDWFRSNIEDAVVSGYDPNVSAENPEELHLDRIVMNIKAENPKVIVVQNNAEWIKKTLEYLGKNSDAVTLVIDYWDMVNQNTQLRERTITLGR